MQENMNELTASSKNEIINRTLIHNITNWWRFVIRFNSIQKTKIWLYL